MTFNLNALNSVKEKIQIQLIALLFAINDLNI